MVFGKIVKRKYRRYSKRKVPTAFKYYVKKAMDRAVEDKTTSDYLTTQFSSLSTTWTERDVTDIAQSLDVGGRVGRRIKIKSIQIRGIIQGGQQNSITDDAMNTVRIVVGTYDGGQNSTTTPLADASCSISSPIARTLNTGARLQRKHCDRVITLASPGPTGSSPGGYMPALRHFNFYRKFKYPFIIDFSSATANYPSRRLIVSMISDSSVSPNPFFSQGFFKVVYEDA